MKKEEISLKYDSSNNGSRSEIRGKRRRTNVILNMLIALVILLIVVVSYIIFLGGNDEKAVDQTENKQTENRQDENNEDENKQDEEQEYAVDSEKTEEEDTDKDRDKEKNKDKDKQHEKQRDNEQEDNESDAVERDLTPEDEEDAVVTIGEGDQNIKRTVENPNWKPIGTTQAGEHTSVFDKESVDWNEMLQAITYATGVPESDMTVWFLGNNGHNKAVGTISSKGTKEKYKVYIDWVDGQGWKPTKVEELNEIEKNNE